MTTLYNAEWTVGETWGLVVNCTKADGTAMAVASARWRLASDDGVVLDLTSTGLSPAITINGGTVSVAVSTNLQDAVPAPECYEHVLEVVEATSNAVSDQARGVISVRANLFRKFP